MGLIPIVGPSQEAGGDNGADVELINVVHTFQYERQTLLGGIPLTHQLQCLRSRIDRLAEVVLLRKGWLWQPNIHVLPHGRPAIE